MSARSDRPRLHPRAIPDNKTPEEERGEESRLKGVSRADAALYIGDMAASLRQIAWGCSLDQLARLLDAVEAEARAAINR